jgi:hypothetical protein
VQTFALPIATARLHEASLAIVQWQLAQALSARRDNV